MWFPQSAVNNDKVKNELIVNVSSIACDLWWWRRNILCNGFMRIRTLKQWGRPFNENKRICIFGLEESHSWLIHPLESFWWFSNLALIRFVCGAIDAGSSSPILFLLYSQTCIRRSPTGNGLKQVESLCRFQRKNDRNATLCHNWPRGVETLAQKYY